MTHQNPAAPEPSFEPSPTHDESLDWQRAHQELSELAKTRARLDWQEGKALLFAFRSGAHVMLGFGTFAEYVERLLGYRPRWTSERLRVAEALELLPEIDQALRDGAVSWSTARELTRVAVSENEHDWLRVAKGRTIRQVEELVSGHKLGDGPGNRTDASSRMHVLRLEVSAETFATFREAMGKIRREAGGPLDEDAALFLIALHVLAGPTDAGRATYQIALTVCDTCGRGWQQGLGEAIEVGSDIVKMACCDAQHLGRIASPAVEALRGGNDEPHVGATGITATSDASNMAPAPAPAAPSKRARQDVPPALRREVMRRDGGRCVVPGCKNAVFLDVHHVVLRSEGGDHDPDRMIVLCSAHHRAEHRGQLIIEGRVSTGLAFRHADRAPYGSVVDPRIAEAHTAAFRALRSLGFRASEAHRALQRVRATLPVG